MVDIALKVYVLTKTLPQNIKEGIKVWRTINPLGSIEQLLSYIRSNYREEENTHATSNAAFLVASTKPKSKWKNKIKSNPNNLNTKGGTNRTVVKRMRIYHVPIARNKVMVGNHASN